MKILSRIQMLKEIVDKYYFAKDHRWEDDDGIEYTEYNRPKLISYKEAVDDLRKIDTDIRGFVKKGAKIIFLDKNKNVLLRYSSLYLNKDN